MTGGIARIGYPYAVPDAALTRIARLAAKALDFPVAFAGVILGDRLSISANSSLGVERIPLDVSVTHVVAKQDAPVVLPDAKADERFEGHPLIHRGPRLRALVKVPLHGLDGTVVGSFAVADRRVRDLSGELVRTVRSYAQVAEEVLECYARREREGKLAEFFASASPGVALGRGARGSGYPREVVHLLGRRWTMNILDQLEESGPMRFSELEARLAGISSRTLSDRLRALVEHGLVVRAVSQGGNPVYFLRDGPGALS